jgi:hypothetical protein
VIADEVMADTNRSVAVSGWLHYRLFDYGFKVLATDLFNVEQGLLIDVGGNNVFKCAMFHVFTLQSVEKILKDPVLHFNDALTESPG